MSIIQTIKRWFCFAWMPMYFGGDSDSQANTSSTTQNTNYVTTEDRRVVASDAAIALSGNGNSASRTENTSFTDNSNRSTSFSDSSNRSTNFADSSQRDSGNTTNISYTTTDFGSVGKALESVTTMGRSAVGLADNSVNGAIETLKRIADTSLQMTTRAFDLAQVTTSNAARTTDTITSFANKQTQLAKDAFEDSTLGRDDNKTAIYAVAAVVVAIGAAWALKKG